MQGTTNQRLGIIGYGRIGSFLYDAIVNDRELGIDIAFVYDVDKARLQGLPEEVILGDIKNFPQTKPGLVVEAAHPNAVREYAEFILRHTDLMIMSVTALAEVELQELIKKTCLEHGTTLFIPHGAIVGLDALIEGREIWEEVSITMKKNPKNLNFECAGIQAESITEPTVLYDGSVKKVCDLFPKNVNSHATVGLAALGLDRTRSILIADPNLEVSIVEVDAKGSGVEIHVSRQNPITGVTGKLTLLSVLESVKRILGKRQWIQFV